MAAQRRKEEAEAFMLATHQALICAPASPVKSSPQRITTWDKDGSASDRDSLLLRLSPEIRGRIYQYAMDNDFHASLDPISSRYPDAVKTRSKTPALMRTCSQMRTEAGGIWYSNTIFIYRLDAVLYKWLQLIGPANQKLIRTVRRDAVLISKRWAEAYIAFTHSRLRDQKLFLAEDAMEVAFWEPPAAVPVPVKQEADQTAANSALVAAATAALGHVVQEDDNVEPEEMLLEDDGFSETAFEFDPDLELEDFAENFLDNIRSDGLLASTGVDSIVDDCSSVVDSKSTGSSVAATKKRSKAEDGDKKKKPKKSAKSSASSVADSATSTKEAEKKEKAEKKKAEKKKNSPSSLAESVMSVKSGKSEKGDRAKPKKPVKPKVKKEPEPEKTWAFVRMETITV